MTLIDVHKYKILSFLELLKIKPREVPPSPSKAPKMEPVKKEEVKK